jgi:hypothetical protein
VSARRVDPPIAPSNESSRTVQNVAWTWAGHAAARRRSHGPVEQR